MTKPQTVAGLEDTLEDLEKQREKAQEKYETLTRRTDAVRDALAILRQQQDQ